MSSPYHLVTQAARRNLRHGSIKGPITIPQSTFDDLTVLSMPQVSFEFLQIASLSRRWHGFDSRTGRQSIIYKESHFHHASNKRPADRL